MRTLNRNKSPFWYLLYDSKRPAKDEYGNETGEELVVYKPAVAMNANISAATGSAQVEQFGSLYRQPHDFSPRTVGGIPSGERSR